MNLYYGMYCIVGGALIILRNISGSTCGMLGETSAKLINSRGSHTVRVRVGSSRRRGGILVPFDR